MARNKLPGWKVIILTLSNCVYVVVTNHNKSMRKVVMTGLKLNRCDRFLEFHQHGHSKKKLQVRQNERRSGRVLRHKYR
jgi:hypothetical protein